MIKIDAIVRPNRFEAVKAALVQLGIEGMTVSEVRGHGRQKGHTEVFRGREYDVDLLPKIKIELVVKPDMVEPAIEAIQGAAYTGKVGDGKIFYYNVAGAVRIRSKERDVAAI
jgi:nitrogen regulatory protein P-II 1